MLITTLMTAFVALYFSYTRGAWLALLTAAIGYWVMKKRLLVYSFLLLELLCVGSVYWLNKDQRYLLFTHHYQTTIFHTDFSEHLVATYQLKDVSTAERFYR